MSNFLGQSKGKGTKQEPFEPIRVENQEGFLQAMMHYMYYQTGEDICFFTLQTQGLKKTFKCTSISMLSKGADVMVNSNSILLTMLLHMIEYERWIIAYNGDRSGIEQAVCWAFELA